MPLGQLVTNLLGRRLGRRKHVPELTREQRLSARPLRNPSLKWQENEEGEVVVVLPRRRDLLGRMLNWAFVVPESKPVTLDEVGSFVWRHCDGEHSFGDLLDLMADKYQVGKREVEMSLGQFMQMLGKRGMVTALVPPEVVEQLDEADRKALGLTQVEPEQQADQTQDQDQADPDADKHAPARPHMPGMPPTRVFGAQSPDKRR